MCSRIPLFVAFLSLLFLPITTAAQNADIAAQLAGIPKSDGFWVVRCAGGEVMGFHKNIVKSVDGVAISFEKKAGAVSHVAFPATMDSAQKRVFGILVSPVFPFRDSIGALPVTWTGPRFNRESVGCSVEEVLRQPPKKAEFEPPRDIAFSNIVGGARLGSATFEYAKDAPKAKASTCLIRKPVVDQLFPPIATDLESAFYDELKTNMAKKFAVADFDDGGKSHGAGTRILIIDALTHSRAPSDFKNRPPYYLVDAVFHLVDGESGRLIWQARAGFPIGEKRDKDIRQVASVFGCL